MKKIISVFLSVLLVALCVMPAFADESAATDGGYKHVFIIGVDGAGRFIKDVDTPNFDRIFENGAVNYTARAEYKTDSAPNWGSILTGVSYTKHGISNGVSGDSERTSDTEFPTIFTYARNAFPDAELASFVNWNNINSGIIETDIGVNKVNITNDSQLTDAICEYLDGGSAPTLLFVQLDEVDHEGHSYGSNSEVYFDAIRRADDYIGRIYDAAERNGLMEDGLFIVASDHGHTTAGGHGGLTMRETNVTLALAGKTVVAGGKLDSDTRNRDVAAIALCALGIDRPDSFTARIPADAFTDIEGEARPNMKDFGGWFISEFLWLLTLVTAPF